MRPGSRASERVMCPKEPCAPWSHVPHGGPRARESLCLMQPCVQGCVRPGSRVDSCVREEGELRCASQAFRCSNAWGHLK